MVRRTKKGYSMAKEARKYTEILPDLNAYIQQHGYGPNLREVAVFLGTTSTSQARRALLQLAQDGHIRYPKVAGQFKARLMKVLEV